MGSDYNIQSGVPSPCSFNHLNSEFYKLDFSIIESFMYWGKLAERNTPWLISIKRLIFGKF